MKKIFFIIFLLLCFENVAIATPTDKDNEEERTITAINKVSRSVVQVCGDVENGSGFYVDLNHIVTASHVVAGSGDVVIVRLDGSMQIGTVVKQDVVNDIALIKTNPGTPVTFSYRIKVGQTALSFGNPEGLNNSASRGIVSALGRGERKNQIQMDTPVNHGDSGGALFDTDGQIIGMIESRLDAERIGFALDAKTLLAFIK